MKGEGSGRKPLEAFIWKGWSLMHKYAFIYNISMWFATRLRKLMPNNIGVWTSVRSVPKLAPKTLHEKVRARQRQRLTTTKTTIKGDN